MKQALAAYRGDSTVLEIDLVWDGESFTPTERWFSIWTLKRLVTDLDSQALVQQTSGTGISYEGSVAKVQLFPDDTRPLRQDTYIWDIQMQNMDTGEVRTAAMGHLSLIGDVTRQLTTSIPVRTEAPPFPGGTAITVDDGTARFVVDGVTWKFTVEEDGEGPSPTNNVSLYESWVTPSNQNLGGFVGDAGMTWRPHPANSTNDGLIYQSIEGPSNASSIEVYLSSFVPANPDYTVYGIFENTNGGGGGIALLFRFNSTALSGYGLRLTGTNTVQLLRFDAGTVTTIGTWTPTAPASRYLLSVAMSGSSLSVSLGNTVLGTVVDATHTAAGNIGLRLPSNGTTVVNLAMWPRLYLSPVANHQLPASGVASFGWDSTTSSWIRGVCPGKSLHFRISGEYCGFRQTSVVGVSGYVLASVNSGPWRRYQNVGAGVHVPIYYEPGNTSEKDIRIVIGGNDRTKDNWTNPDNGVQITQIVTAAGDVPTAPPARAGKMVAIGDSITRAGALTQDYRWGNAVKGWAWLLAESKNYELDVVAYSSQGYETAGSGNVPAAKTALAYHSNGRARAVDASVNLVTIAHGTNDGGVTQSALKSAAQTTWATARTLYPNAKIVVILPLGYAINPATPSAAGYRDTMNSALVSQFATWGDSNSQIISLTGKVYGNSLTGPNGSGSNIYTTDLIHPNEMCNALMAADIAALL